METVNCLNRGRPSSWYSASDTVGLGREGEVEMEQKTLCTELASSIFCAGLTAWCFLPDPTPAVSLRGR